MKSFCDKLDYAMKSERLLKYFREVLHLKT